MKKNGADGPRKVFRKKKNNTMKKHQKVDSILSISTNSNSTSMELKCETCLADYTLHTVGSSKTCLKYGTRGSLSSAVSTCGKDGARPPLPINSQENEDLLMFFNSNRDREQDSFALDLNDVKTEGKFVNSKGEKVNFTNWHGTEPDNQNGNQHYVTMWDDGSWNDFNGYFFNSVIICQMDCQTGEFKKSI